MYENLATIAIFAFVYSTIAGRVENTVLTGPILFLAFGLIAGPMGLGLLELEITEFGLRAMADLTLALVLFIDAAKADHAVMRSHSFIPLRMLMIGLPLSIVLGGVFGFLLFPELSILELCILGTMLAATDAALGKAVISNRAVPAKVREGLNVESGLNDGLCVPVLLVFLALAKSKDVDVDEGGLLALHLVAEEIGIGVLVGLGLTALGVRLIAFGKKRGWFTDIWLQIPVMTLAIACFTTAQSLDGSGYIAAFVGGLLFGHLSKSATEHLVLAAEGTGELLAMATWIAFGAAVVGQLWGNMTWQVFAYSLLSLTVIRMLPMLLSLVGSGERVESTMFLAWFGPRGLASIVFGLIVVNAHLPNGSILTNIVVCTVTLSVVVHGLTAKLLSTAYAARMKRLGE